MDVESVLAGCQAANCSRNFNAAFDFGEGDLTLGFAAALGGVQDHDRLGDGTAHHHRAGSFCACAQRLAAREQAAAIARAGTIALRRSVIGVVSWWDRVVEVKVQSLV